MLNRCNNPEWPHYNRYGGRGIKVCGRWIKFENFLADMGKRPKRKTLDRVNNDGNYEPSNCRWATHAEQVRSITGEKASAAKLTWDSVYQIRTRLKLGESLSSIARHYDVSRTAIRHIKINKSWRIVQ